MNISEKENTESELKNAILICEFMNSDYNLDYSSWDCLMQVVEKIESIYDKKNGRFAVQISQNGCQIQSTKFRPHEKCDAYYSDTYDKDKITACWKEVIGFINWYNINVKNK